MIVLATFWTTSEIPLAPVPVRRIFFAVPYIHIVVSVTRYMCFTCTRQEHLHYSRACHGIGVCDMQRWCWASLSSHITHPYGGYFKPYFFTRFLRTGSPVLSFFTYHKTSVCIFGSSIPRIESADVKLFCSIRSLFCFINPRPHSFLLCCVLFPPRLLSFFDHSFCSTS